MKKRKPLRREPRWQPMEAAIFTGDTDDPVINAMQSEPGFVGVFINNLYQVTYREVEAPAFSGGDSESVPLLAWLCIRRRDSSPVHDWRHLQNIKNDLCGSEREALELYPAESRLVDTANQYHLWVLPLGLSAPFGYAEREVADVPFGKNKNRPFADPPEDLNAFVGKERNEALTRKVKLVQ